MQSLFPNLGVAQPAPLSSSIAPTIFTPATAQPAVGFPSGQTLQQPEQDTSRRPFQYIQSCYDPASPHYPFRHFFYNRLLLTQPTAGPGGISQESLPKPQNVPDRLWAQVFEENPNPLKYIPVMANGFEDLRQRARWQDAQMEAQSAKLSELEATLQELVEKHDAAKSGVVSRKLQEALNRQSALALKTIRIMRRMEVLRRAGTRLSDNEHEMKRLLQLLVQKLSQPPLDQTSLRLAAFQVQALDEAGHTSPPSTLVDSAMLAKALPILEQQQQVLSHLVEKVVKAAHDLDIMAHGYQLP